MLFYLMLTGCISTTSKSLFCFWSNMTFLKWKKEPNVISTKVKDVFFFNVMDAEHQAEVHCCWSSPMARMNSHSSD